MDELNGFPVVTAVDAAQWEAWVAAHHDLPGGAWVTIAKQGAPTRSVTITEALDVCLCWGWIDSVRRSFDAGSYLQKYSPRRRRSSWSQVNVAKAEALISSGRMREPGLAEITTARADGRWAAAYASQREATTPPDLVAALLESPTAGAVFAALSRTEQYVLALPLAKSTTPAVRATRLARLVASLEARRAGG